MTHKKKNQNTAQTPPKNTRHLTAERLHDLARKWKRAQSAERAVALFTYSPEYGVQTAVLGCDEHLTEIVTSGVRLRLASQLRDTEPTRTFPSLRKTRRRRSPRTSGSVCARGFFRSTSRSKHEKDNV